MNPKYQQWLYLNKVEEVRQRVATNDYYNIVMATGLVRHLLLEDFALADKVNRHFPQRAKLKFEVMPGRIGDDDEILKHTMLAFRNIEPSPDCPPDSVFKPKKMSRDELLSTCIIVFQGKRITVKNVLDAYAYARGGVHLNDRPGELEEALFELDSLVVYEGQPASVKMLKEIINVILAGLQPLTDAVLAELSKAQDEQNQ
jgi:hypothetical protein